MVPMFGVKRGTISPNNADKSREVIEMLKGDLKIKIPSLFVRAGLDNFICNKTIEEKFDRIPQEADKTMMTLDEASHQLMEDKEQVLFLTREICNWFDLRL